MEHLRLTFMEAKRKELGSFFQNDVWVYDEAANALKERILRAHFILKWSKWPNGEPHAKARLITHRFQDPHTLNFVVVTSSPDASSPALSLRHSCRARPIRRLGHSGYKGRSLCMVWLLVDAPRAW